MRLKRHGIFTILISLFSLNLSAQSNYQNFVPNVFNKSPTSASFAKYGDYPMNLYSGLPDISIPLYTVESGGLQVPITLSYHASGIKVEQAATWVGLGWTLSTGGAVSRTIYGGPDDVMGYFHRFKHPLSYDVQNDNDVHDLYSVAYYKGNDTRPDIFSYSFPGHDGKFFFNALEHYKVKTIPYTPISIKNTAADIGYDTAKFSIADEHGNAYRFGYQYREITASTTTSSRPTSYATTSWMLESMISQNKHDTIRFTYQPQSNSLPDQTGQSLTVEDQDASSGSTAGPHPYAINNWQPFASNTATTVNEQDPKEIFFKNGKVVFKLSTNPRTDLNGINPYPLEAIQVFMYDFKKGQYESSPQKTVVFKRSYFAVVSGTQGRLKLDSIQILDKAGSIVQVYRFAYNSMTLPLYTSYSKDFWGYYNGKMDNPAITNKTLIPRMQIPIEPSVTVPTPPYYRYIGSSDSTSRDPDTSKMQAGVLTRIDYPTGGYTNFTYQTNRYKAGGVTYFTGGLRIASIAGYSSQVATTPILKTYQYDDAVPNFVTTGGGLLNFGFFINNNRLAYKQTASIDVTKRVRTYYSESSSALTPTEGNPVAYRTVTEYIGDPVTNAGISIYSYRHIGDYMSGSTGWTGIPLTVDYFYARGQLTSKADYLRKSDGTYQIVKDEIHTYSAFTDSVYENVGLIVGQRRQTEGSGGPQLFLNGTSNDDRNSYPYMGYTIRSGDSYPTSVTTKIYDQNDPAKYQSSTVEYKYDNFIHQQVSRTRTVDSKGNTKVTVSKYPADYLDSGGVTNDYRLDRMLADNMQTTLIEKWDSVKNVNTGVNAVVGGQLNLFQTNTTSVVPLAIKKLNVSSPITNFTPASVVSGNLTGDSRYVQMISFDQYEYQTNNLLQYTPRNAGPTSIIWDYNNQYPIAQVKNAPFVNGTSKRTYAYTSFEANGKGNWNIVGTPVTERYAPTGAKVLSKGSASLSNFDLSKPHILTYWTNSTAAIVNADGNPSSGTALRTVNGWTLYRHNIPAATSNSSISIYGFDKIDELKCYPADAQMVTYTFDTDGLSETTDEKDQISRFEYDPAQRLQFARDWQFNIVKANDYHNYNMTIGSDAIPATTFTRNNCPAGTVPGSTTYSVAANSYYSSTKASANALANYDLQTNGQAKANDPAICGCPIEYNTFTFKDQTGLGTYQAAFTASGTQYIPIPNGTSTKQIATGIYTIQISTIGTQVKTFQLSGHSMITGHTATFTNVNVSPGSAQLTLTIY